MRGSIGRLKRRVNQAATLPITQADVTGLTGYYAASSPAPLTSPIVQSDVTGLTGYYQSSTADLTQSRITGLTGYYAASSPAPLTSPIAQSDVTGLTGYYQSSTADLTQSRITGLTGYYQPSTTLTTKGDILTRTSSGFERLAVGTNDQVLTADSAQATGLKWAASGGGAANTVVTDMAMQAADTSTTSTSYVDFGVLSKTFTPGTGNNVIISAAAVVNNSGANNNIIAVNRAGTVTDKAEAGTNDGETSGATTVPLAVYYRYTNQSGSTTYKMQWKTSAGTIACNAGSNELYQGVMIVDEVKV